MSRALASPPPPSRYTYAAAVAEVERHLAERPLGARKTIAATINLTEQQFSHRMRGAYARFSIEHFGAIADAWKMPPGWPFVPAPLASAAQKKGRGP